MNEMGFLDLFITNYWTDVNVGVVDLQELILEHKLFPWLGHLDFVSGSITNKRCSGNPTDTNTTVDT